MLETFTYWGPVASKMSRICLSMLLRWHCRGGCIVCRRTAALSCSSSVQLLCDEAAWSYRASMTFTCLVPEHTYWLCLTWRFVMCVLNNRSCVKDLKGHRGHWRRPSHLMDIFCKSLETSLVSFSKDSSLQRSHHRRTVCLQTPQDDPPHDLRNHLHRNR